MQRINFLNKKADSKILSIWWFLILIIIATGIVIGVMIFFSSNLDVKSNEADIMANKILDCLIKNGYINEDFLVDNTNFLDNCFLNKAMIVNSGNYYINLKIYEESLVKTSLIYGNHALEEDCKIKLNFIEAKNYPECVEKSSIAMDSNGKIFRIDIITGSKQDNQN